MKKGLGDEEIAARFFVNATVVKQRLRLAAVAPTLLDNYAEDGMTLEQLMAFTVSADCDCPGSVALAHFAWIMRREP